MIARVKYFNIRDVSLHMERPGLERLSDDESPGGKILPAAIRASIKPATKACRVSMPWLH